MPFRTPGARFDHVHVHIVGPLPLSRGFTYILTFVDRYTRWPESSTYSRHYGTDSRGELC